MFYARAGGLRGAATFPGPVVPVAFDGALLGHSSGGCSGVTPLSLFIHFEPGPRNAQAKIRDTEMNTRCR